ncbi:MAG: thioredoxin domain-containing protein [Anaerolineae bacterium]|nr:thioredoxin domain-containing protein [Anaerolineae bacterium]
MSNRLADETRPYLLQHADNPVDWYPWSEEALQKAKAEDRPIFLSVGYSACHWCHVMAHESFEDADTAAVMNAHFVNVKVDREERPDLDRIYMNAVQALTGRGGWPMSVFLTTDGEPFYGGTYFPPTPRYGMPAFTDVLKAVNDAWQNRRQELVEGSKQLVAAIEQQMAINADAQPETLEPETLNTAYGHIQRSFDHVHGGWSFDHEPPVRAHGRVAAPKFPQPMTIEFLLRTHHTTGDAQALQMVTQTLDAMARGGMYDQLGGGFHRYSVDNHWTVPHFEKMLYDNAQLARVYLHAWQVTGNSFYRAIAEETLDYVAREMLSPEGGFYATQDADSEGEEGKFFLWTPDEIRAVLGDEADRFLEAYGATGDGNASTGSAHGFEGKSILELKCSLEERSELAGARRKLFEAREQRIHPRRDEKVLTSWNGLMLAAFAEAARVLGRDDYRQIAERDAEFLLSELRTPEGRLHHVWKESVAKVNGYLEDYTHLIEGLIELYQTTFDPRWYKAARELADAMIEHFSASNAGNAFCIAGFYDNSDDHETLITRPRELQDNATPSGSGMAALVLQRLAGLAAEPRYAEIARQSLAAVQPLLAQYPLGFGQWLQALSYALARPREIAIVGDAALPPARALLEACAGYRPHQVVAAGVEDQVPLLQGRKQIEGQAAAYVCIDLTCRPPVTEPEALKALLQDKSI